jgi:hypothetical protein
MFRFQGLVTLLAVYFFQALWPIFQSQALLGFALQSFALLNQLCLSQGLCSLAVGTLGSGSGQWPLPELLGFDSRALLWQSSRTR